MADLIEAIEFSISLAREAGEIMKQNFALGMNREWKEDNSPLTITDQKINLLVLSKIRQKFPEHSILSEEGNDLTDSEFTWVCDPLDGTIPFSHGYPTFCFSLALTIKGESVLGVVYDPICDRMFTAQKGRGAFLNGNRISVSVEEVLSKTSLVAFDGQSKLPKLRELLRQYGSRVPSLYSCVYASMLVATGEFMGEIFGNSTPWDAAAVKVIIEEAGGKVTSLTGGDQLYNQKINGFIASNGKVHAQLVELVRASIE